MAVRVKSRQVVKPSEPTWNGILPLTELDQIGVITHSTGIYFYKAPTNVAHDGLNPITNKSITSALKDSLSRVLVPFYPLAGRLHWIEGDRLELECNAKGVEFIEAECSKQISDFGDFSSSNFKEFHGLVPSVDYGKPIHEIPLFLVQFTRFRCGGFSVASSFSHSVVDGQGIFHFTIEWARLARGDSLAAQPYIDRAILQDRDQYIGHSIDNRNGIQNGDHFSRLPRLIGESKEDEKNDYVSRKTNKTMVDLVATMLPLSRSQVQKLRKAANRGLEYECRPYGRFEAIAAHIWRCVCKARGLKAEQLTALCFTVDSRDRMDPPLPPRYFGNAIVDVVTTSRVGELKLKPLSHVCSRIRETTDKVTNDYVCTTIDFFKRQPNLSKYQDRAALGTSTDGIYYGNPNIGLASWLNLPICGLDFGFGKEIFMGPGSCDFDGDIMVLPGYNEVGSVLVALGLQGSHMEKFKKCFYEDIDDLEFGQKMVL